MGDIVYGQSNDVPRLMLHAEALVGPHPLGGQFEYRADWPEDFASMVTALNLI